ncbi:XkdF-like putative serine protease domain-containing protein [Halococcus hamelinensis]|uniref:Phage-like element PBSX protein XkdF domain-containing protein n=1 Tax=Halococcus hamelinensis 100A6 TaxID=1132509 RepID=M0M242_9EURY|nr:XkdF-like putative serine protease domain-containing protein [Halococcus hamelinensis]EMA38465.1 hypothetical protein C447_09932 [Halococcus hamelinensis 100A6]
MNHSTPRHFSKTVAIKATDDEERTATGVVLTTNELDRQLDFLDADGVRSMFNPSPDDGVMHTKFPDGHAELTRNEVLDENEDIDGHAFKADDWVIQRHYTDDERWELVKSGVLSAYSIGGDVTDAEEYDDVDDLPDEVEIPDVVVPESVPDDYWPISKITNGSVSEISDVDIGAVPSASHAVVKSIGKNVLDQTDGRDEFLALMEQRGATEDGANDLYDYLEGIDKDYDMSKSAPDDATIGRRVKRMIGFGGDDPSFEKLAKDLTDEQGQLVQQAIDEFVEAQGESDVGTLRDWMWNKGDDLDPDVRTALEAALDEFYDDQYPNNQQVNSDFAEWVSSETDIELTIDMTDDDNPGGDDKSLPEQNAAQLEETNQKLDDVLEAIGKAGDGDGDGDGDGGGDGGDDKSLPEKNAEQIEDMTEKVGEVSKRVEQVVEQGGGGGGGSQQLGETNENETTSEKADILDIEQEIFG